MDRPELLLPDVIDIAREAAELILTIYQRSFDVEHKEDNTPVTEADIAADQLICAGLTRLCPDIPIISEEGDSLAFSERSQWARCWLVDPLDGTREFIKGSGDFTVNIALIDQGEAVLGVILAPVTGDVYFAARGFGAYKQKASGARTGLLVRACDPRRITITAGNSAYGPRFTQFLNQFPRRQLLRAGSSLKSCFVAEGRADIYLRYGPTSEWDTAAAQCIVEEAGGQITDAEFKPLRYNRRETLLNPPFIVVGDGGHDWSRYLEPFHDLENA